MVHLIGFQTLQKCILSEFVYFYYLCINHLRKEMIDERIILQVLAEQRDEIKGYDPSAWVSRREEDLFEFDSSLAQVVIGVRRSGKATKFPSLPSGRESCKGSIRSKKEKSFIFTDSAPFTINASPKRLAFAA